MIQTARPNNAPGFDSEQDLTPTTRFISECIKDLSLEDLHQLRAAIKPIYLTRMVLASVEAITKAAIAEKVPTLLTRFVTDELSYGDFSLTIYYIEDIIAKRIIELTTPKQDPDSDIPY